MIIPFHWAEIKERKNIKNNYKKYPESNYAQKPTPIKGQRALTEKKQIEKERNTRWPKLLIFPNFFVGKIFRIIIIYQEVGKGQIRWWKWEKQNKTKKDKRKNYREN